MGSMMERLRASGRRDRVRPLLILIAAATIAMLAMTACSPAAPEPAAPAAQTITDKGTPYADLLVPELKASVTDQAVGVAVDTPVTVTAGNGVLGDVSMVNEQGRVVAGRLSQDG